ncbi:hypothetical protein MTX78_14275 [Hymenobacter tibetensis]|uniref:Uncharacterized protein n=1 Tax=Hymenobacter tibetensis TaxID=497967 RepID=A0ABY4CWB9_9BACT|nr:hypothetical protein [Hymenobacter tibetensis]UOG73289.1 hypothetical protein MTX78_14275 [Hymenobacter tibetensis]
MLYESFRLCKTPSQLLKENDEVRSSRSRRHWPIAPPMFQVEYQLKLAQLSRGQIVDYFFVCCTRRFPTNELNVILAELYEEVGPTPTLLGLEIVTVRALPFRAAYQ